MARYLVVLVACCAVLAQTPALEKKVIEYGWDVPPGSAGALRSGRDKANAGAPLGFDLRPIVEAAAKRERGETGP
ncbi:MAG: hypothetical protein FJY92_04045 [Candidatus Hydrogenedentes bacterium]|nr:hypothetical protein [Candidatus Hydrogenedentota bacterium]